MKVLFDVNVIVDLWERSEDFAPSYQAVDIAFNRKFETCITASMVPSIVYLLSARKILSKREAHWAFGEIMELFDILDTTAADCRLARERGQGDFEDDLISWSAHRCGVDCIVTRNKRDFENSPVPTLTPQEFVDLYKPANIEYGFEKWDEEAKRND